MDTSKHPKGLAVLFGTEAGERFSYYGNRAIFFLYLMKAMGLSKETASQIYGSYTGLVYLTPLIGGIIADRVWGNRRSILVGGLLMALGEFCMFLSASNYQNHDLAYTYMWVGLFGIILGNGFIKPNITTMVGHLYKDDDPKKDRGYSYFYMGINFGAIFSGIICGTLGDTGHPADFKWGFLAAFIGMCVAMIQFIFLRKHLVTPNGRPVGVIPNNKLEKKAKDTKKVPIQNILLWSVIGIVLYLVFYFAADLGWVGSIIYSVSIAVPGLIVTDPGLTKKERNGIWAIIIIAFFFIFFIVCFEQAGASLTYFADKQMDRTVNIHMAMGTLYLITLGLACLIYYAMKTSMEFPKAFDWFCRLIGIALFLLMVVAYSRSSVFELKEISASVFNSANAIFVVMLVPIFDSMWKYFNKKGVEPPSPYKQALGLFFVSVGYLVIATAVKDIGTAKVSMIWLIALYFLHTVGELCYSPVGLSLVSRIAPPRLVSLLMATYFLSIATANKFAGIVSSYYPGDGKPTTMLGYTMATPYQFFMLLVVVAIVASVVMFILSKTILRLMGEVK